MQQLCSYLLYPTVVSVFPETRFKSTRTLPFSRIAQRSLTLRPAHSRCHQFVATITRRLQPCRYLHNCSGYYWLELWPGGTFTHRKAPPLHGAPRKRVLGNGGLLEVQRIAHQKSFANFADAASGPKESQISRPIANIVFATARPCSLASCTAGVVGLIFQCNERDRHWLHAQTDRHGL